MTDEQEAGAIVATCHCGAVTITLAAPPSEIVNCNCSLCRSYGVLWAYYPAGEVVMPPDSGPTDRYAWNGRHVDFLRCRLCGCVTHWVPWDSTRDRRGINARLLPVDVLLAARVRHRDGAGTGQYLDLPSPDRNSAPQ